MRSFTSDSSRHARRLLPAVCGFLIVAAASATAQDQDVLLEIRSRGGQMVTLALPSPATGPGTEEYTKILYEVLWNDLHHSMAFELVDPDRYPEPGAEGTIPWERWRATGARALIRSSVEMQNDRIYVEFRLFDVPTGEQRTGKRYTQVIAGLDPQEAAYQMRMVAHRFNDEAVLYYTGVRGVASDYIAFSSDRPFPASSPPDPRKELFLMDYDGERQRQITTDRSIALAPSFSPQGDRMIYQTYRAHAGVPNTEIFMILKTGGAPRPALACKGTTTGPAFSPDGTRIAVSSSCGVGNPEIHTLRPDGSDMVQLTRNPAADVSPSWSPNGREIAFISDRSGGPQIYVMDATGLNTRGCRPPAARRTTRPGNRAAAS